MPSGARLILAGDIVRHSRNNSLVEFYVQRTPNLPADQSVDAYNRCAVLMSDRRYFQLSCPIALTWKSDARFTRLLDLPSAVRTAARQTR